MDRGGYLWKENIRFIVIHSQTEKGMLEFPAIAKRGGETEKAMKHSPKWTGRSKNMGGRKYGTILLLMA